jgi:hypothetical protein
MAVKGVRKQIVSVSGENDQKPKFSRSAILTFEAWRRLSHRKMNIVQKLAG